jgi:surface protein
MFYGCTELEELDTSQWNTAAATDFTYCFAACSKLNPLEVSSWNMSSVTTLYYCFADVPYVKGYENWDISNCKSLCGTFGGCHNEYFDVSLWDTSSCLDFAVTFKLCSNAKEIKGLNNWNTSNGKGFLGMFAKCHSLRSLDLSSFDTRNASNNWKGEYYYGNMDAMFSETYALQKITLSENFSFKGDGTCPPAVIPTPDSAYIPTTEGFWYDDFGKKYAPSEVPQKTAGTYYASLELMNRFYGIDRLTLLEFAKSVKAITGLYGNITFADMKNALDNFDGL